MTVGFADHIVVVVFIGLVTWAAVSDFRTYMIPNSVTLSIAVLYPAHVAASPAAVDWIGATSVAAVILVVGVVLFALRVAGGGDVKLLSATALWAGPAQIIPFLLFVSVTGAVLAMVAMSHLRFIRPWPSGALASDQETAVKLRQSVPYGVAIASGGLWVASRMLVG